MEVAYVHTCMCIYQLSEMNNSAEKDSVIIFVFLKGGNKIKQLLTFKFQIEIAK